MESQEQRDPFKNAVNQTTTLPSAEKPAQPPKGKGRRFMEDREQRDRFAEIYLAHFLKQGTFSMGIVGATETRAQREAIATHAYALADAMMAQRGSYAGL